MSETKQLDYHEAETKISEREEKEAEIIYEKTKEAREEAEAADCARDEGDDVAPDATTEENKVKPGKGELIIAKGVEKASEAEVESQLNGKRSRGNGSEDEDDGNIPPALPPRPPRPRQYCTCTCGMEDLEAPAARNERRVPRCCWSNGIRKYVFFCTACGSLSILLGAVFLTVYFMLKSYTSSLNHFETIPTYVPSGMLIVTGFLIICLAWRKNRNSFLMKLGGLCSLCCAVLCVSVTVTTTVIHMNRLQTLRECLYTQKTQSCTCYSILIENNRISDEGLKFVFNSTPDCEVIHGALYSCLRAIFGLSVIGILVCIFSCMLVYQLLSHEKKKMYWAQLEMRCRYLYRQQRNPHYYGCCDDCRYPPHPHELFPWELMRNRFWSTGRIGNLYTPNPEDRENHRLRSGWNWRRLPWSRGGGEAGGHANEPPRTNLGSTDSQYGFNSTPAIDGAPYTVLDPRTALPPCQPVAPGADITEGGFYSWGPPPPYVSNRNSANNSPARRTIGDLLHQVSPVRRNDNVSPARTMHHVHRHVHRKRQWSSPRQVANNPQYHGSTPTKSTTEKANSIQQPHHQQQQQQPPRLPELNTHWSASLTSVTGGYQKNVRNPENYENAYEPENFPPANGFNTLPSLKKKSQLRASEVFQNEPFTAYFFSSSENLGCSTSNVAPDTANPSLAGSPSPRGFVKKSQQTLYNPATSQQNQKDSAGDPSRGSPTYEGSNSMACRNPATFQPGTSRNSSLVRKLFVNCSPTKQKPASEASQIYSAEKENLLAVPRKILNKKLVESEPGYEANENVITFHYRVGIPRSPNVQNFNHFADKGPAQPISWEGGKDEAPGEGRVNEKTAPDAETHGVRMKEVKYIIQDVELVQKPGGGPMKECGKSLSSGRGPPRHSTMKSDSRKPNGVENGGFQQCEDMKTYDKYFPGEPSRSPGNYSPRYQEGRREMPAFQQNEFEANDDCLSENMKPNENESDAYFGDISNSSCYGPDSVLYEETDDGSGNAPRFSSTGHPILNRQNLKMIEECLEFKATVPTYADTGSESYGKHKGARHVRVKSSGNLEKGHRRLVPYYGEEPKYFPPQEDISEGEQLNRRDVTSNDEQSSGSLTADSGVSSARSFHPKSMDGNFCEPEYQVKTSDASWGYYGMEPTYESIRPAPGNKLSGAQDALGSFAHPLFQKPKSLTRGVRCKEAELTQKKTSDEETDQKMEVQNPRGRTFGKVKNAETEEVTNRLLSTCSLNNSSHYLSEDYRRFQSSPQGGDAEDADEDFGEGPRNSPRPLPRTTATAAAAGKPKPGARDFASKQMMYVQGKDGSDHFQRARDKYKDNFKSEYKSHEKQVASRSKPAVPARPVHLAVTDPKKGSKGEPLGVPNVLQHNEAIRPVPKRRRNALDEPEERDEEVGTHSVNV